MMMNINQYCSWAVQKENGAQRYPNLEKTQGAL